MKRLICILYIIVSVPLLTGCGSLYANRREVERLLVIQTMGIDRSGGGVRLSLASAADKSSGPVRLSADGESVSTAISRIRSRSFEEELFCAHVNHVILGEDAARQGIDDVLAYLCRSPDIRIDVPLYVVRNGTAADLVLDTGNGEIGASEILDGIQSRLDGRAEYRSFTAAEVVRSLERCGSALICALDHTGSAEDSGDGKRDATAAPCGYAVIRNGALCGFLDRDEAVGAGFLMNDVGISELTVTAAGDKTVTMELERGSTRIEPLYAADGQLAGLDVAVLAEASVLETAGDAPGDDYLTARLEEAVSDRVNAALTASRELNADFAGLSQGGELSSLSPEQLTGLEWRIRVRGHILHTNDVRDA